MSFIQHKSKRKIIFGTLSGMLQNKINFHLVKIIMKYEISEIVMKINLFELNFL